MEEKQLPRSFDDLIEQLNSVDREEVAVDNEETPAFVAAMVAEKLAALVNHIVT